MTFPIPSPDTSRTGPATVPPGDPGEAAWPGEPEGDADAPWSRPLGSASEVFGAFLKLGLTSFGGPIAHLGYFRTELVSRRRWLTDATFAELVALCQFLPGPSSSQVGLTLGYLRAGPLGALAAFVAFTLPSALAMLAVALGAGFLSGPAGQGALAGLKVAAVAIVAQAVLGMSRTLCPDRLRALLAALAVVLAALVPGAPAMLLAIGIGAVVGVVALPQAAAPAAGAPLPAPRVSTGVALLLLFVVLLAGLPLIAPAGSALALFDVFYRSGALVFGGGHVVLPLLAQQVVVPGWIGSDGFLAGYGAAQAVPGPLFSFAAYLGGVIGPVPGGTPGFPGAVAGALLGLAGLFLPGFLLVLGVLPFWDRLRARGPVRGLVAGANAAVVGILAAALYDPLFASAVTGRAGFALAAAGFVALTALRVPAWAVVVVSALVGAVVGTGF